MCLLEQQHVQRQQPPDLYSSWARGVIQLVSLPPGQEDRTALTFSSCTTAACRISGSNADKHSPPDGSQRRCTEIY
jgi:hypothetical protein